SADVLLASGSGLREAGLSRQRLLQRHSRLIFCDVVSWPTGMDSRVPGHDDFLAARAGLYDQRFHKTEVFTPLPPAFPLVSTSAGLVTAYSVLAAVRMRSQTQGNQSVRISEFGAAFQVLRLRLIRANRTDPEVAAPPGFTGLYRCADR